MYQIYLDELYGGLQKPNEDEKKKYACYIEVNRDGWLFPTLHWILNSQKYFAPFCRLAEKKVAIGYTYEDSTVAEPEPQSDKDEDNSESSESEEDEGIPDIGKLMGWAD